MSTSGDSCCLLSVKKQKHDFQVFAFVQCIIKQLLDSVFVISRIIKVEVRVISRSQRLRLITLTETRGKSYQPKPKPKALIILDITKTSSNNCLQSKKQTYNHYQKKTNCFCVALQIELQSIKFTKSAHVQCFSETFCKNPFISRKC